MLSYFDAVVLGVVEGLTEFLPVSSTGHLTVAEKMLGLKVDEPAVTAYTAIIQLGAILATLLFFGRKIIRLFLAWVRGLTDAQARTNHDYPWPGRSSSARSRSGSSASWRVTSSKVPCVIFGSSPRPWSPGVR